MLRGVLRHGAALLRMPAQVASGTSYSTGVAAASGEDPLKGLIDSLSTENELSPIVERGPSTYSNVTTFKQLKKSLDSCKGPLASADYLSMLRTALFLDKEKSAASTFVKACGKSPSEADIAEMVVNDDFIGTMTALLELGLRDEKVFSVYEKKLLSSINEADISLSAMIPFVIASNRSFYVWPKPLQTALKAALTSQIREIDSASTLIAVLTHWDMFDKEVSQAAAEKTAELLGSDVSCCALTVGEMCSLVGRFADRGVRDRRLLPLLSARITDHRSPLSVRQLVALAASCAKLNYFDARVMRRIARDLLVDVNNLHSWSDVSSLLRLRFGEMSAWNALATWVNSHADGAPLEAFSIVVAGMARNGIEECRPAALKLAERVRRESAPSQNVWLSTIQSLAYYRALTPQLAETVLNRDFVSQLLQSASSDGDRLFKAMKLLQINACVRVDLAKSYSGPTVGQSDLSSFVKFNDETTRLARLNKYGKKELETCNQFLSDVLFKLGSPSTHIGPSCIDNDGVLLDARIVCEKDSSRLVAITKWGESVPRPIMFFGWGQTRQVMDTVRTEENALLGSDQLSLRLLRAKGVKPIVVFHSELNALPSTADKLQFLRKKIVDTA
ncbi:unnamed protein product [Nippostrongylus brasiliensis]|uniref:RAP domain-containing protein n=1 Tax=Nippostrongylus brasiliensis TaxID=27835 RepID=A0A0N4YAC5_NIPBR|nr:unnamed protein product [Nippostrongylus brasiliensis]